MGKPQYAKFIHDFFATEGNLANHSLFESYACPNPPLPAPDRSRP
jgi:hypothetical protein